MKPLISVIVPVYNTGRYLNRCMDSIINNDYKNLEIICINDGSTDESLNILREYEAKDNRIVVVDVSNGGVSKARNIGLERASGEFICFIDSDDWIHKKFFSTLLYFAEKTKAEIVVSSFIRTGDYVRDEQINLSDIKTQYHKRNALENHDFKSFIWGRIYSKNVIKNLRFVNEVKISEDTLFNIEVISNNENIRVVLLNAELYYYFDRNDSAINTCNGRDFKILSYIYLERAEKADSKYITGIYLNEAFKNTFSVRYLTKSIADDELRIEIKALIKRCLRLERKEKPFSFKKSVLYSLLEHFPFLYTSFRKIKER